jgi:hypothetical protein
MSLSIIHFAEEKSYSLPRAYGVCSVVRVCRVHGVRMTKIGSFEHMRGWREAMALVRIVCEAMKSDKGFFIQYLLSNMNDCPIVIDLCAFFEPGRAGWILLSKPAN